ncbi:MAG: glycosyltransferase [Isosphaera sp.]|nr:glycosyltransferase [Isosphaera sp.]
MRVVALVEAVDHVCCRYRVAAFRAAFAAAGHLLDIRPLPTSLFGRLAIGRDLTDADVVVVQRKLLPEWVVARLRRRVRRLVFDFDDAVWLRDSYSAKGFDDPQRARRFRAVVSASDLVVAGNDYLAAAAGRFAPGRVRVVPTCVEPAAYPVAAGVGRPGLQLVWVGSGSTLRGLERFTPTLSAVGRAVPGVRLKLICDRFVKIPDLLVDECVWGEDTEAAEIAAADIGVSWVPDDPWSRGKCGLKVLQYQAAGLPVVANPVGVHPELVRDGETGFLATSAAEWVSAVARHAADIGLRRRLGAAGRRQVGERYSVAAGAAAWLAALDELASPRLRKSG